MYLTLLQSFERMPLFVKDHRPEVYLLTFVICAGFSFAMLILYGRAKSEKWMQYLGIAPGILALMYLIRLGLWYAGEHNPSTSVSYEEKLPVVFFLQLLSIANNIWFIATARAINDKKPAFPRWCVGLALAALLTTVIGYSMPQDKWPSHFLARSFDDVFSALSLVLLGHAIYRNISSRVRRSSAYLALGSGLAYAVIFITHWLSPMIASVLSSGGNFTVEMQIIDSLLRAASLPVKILIFLPAYVLVQRFVETLHDLTKLQDKVIDARQDYLSSDGVVRSIQDKLGDEVVLTILLPGEKNRLIAAISWPNNEPKRGVEVLNWSQADSLVHQVLSESRTLTRSSKKGAPYTVIEPIEAHGTAIGCLKIRRHKYPFSQMAIRQIKAIANLVSPAVQSYRELSALDLLSIRFAEKQSQDKTYSPKEAIKVIADILHDVFSPYVTRLALNFGFQTIESAYRGDAEAIEFLEGQDWSDWDHLQLDFKDEKFKLFKKKLTAMTEDIAVMAAANGIGETKKRPIIGNLVFAILRAGDKAGRPALGTSYLHRRAAATLSADAYLDFARDYFSSLLKQLGVGLSRDKLSIEEWFEPVAKTAQDAGFCWVVAAIGGKKILGESDSVSLPAVQETLKGQNEICTIHEKEGIRIRAFATASPLNNGRQIIELNLSGEKSTIWLGVERYGFKGELSFNSPWKNFLIDFTRMADAALTRVTYGLELQRKQVEAASYQGLATAAVTIGTIIHQLSNLAHGQVVSISTLLNALAIGKLTADENLVGLMRSMKRSSERMIHFLANITNVTKTDDRRPSQLAEAVQQAAVLFETSLLQRKITLQIDVDKSMVLDVPFNVAALAIANLIGNAKDAMPHGGKIYIGAQNNGEFVLCRVADEGHGIPSSIRDKVFDLGFSTKNGEGSGWGLYLTQRSLLENRSKIEITATSEKGTAFTIHFPKPK